MIYWKFMSDHCSIMFNSFTMGISKNSKLERAKNEAVIFNSCWDYVHSQLIIYFKKKIFFWGGVKGGEGMRQYKANFIVIVIIYLFM